MCLIVWAYETHPRYRLVLAANRDEFYDRPTRSLAYWDDFPQVLAGRDLKAQGTWLGMTRTGRLAAITNFREPHNIKTQAPSRGQLVTDFLTGNEPPEQYSGKILATGQQYNGYNLLLGDLDRLCHCSNRSAEVTNLEPGYYGLSNHLLDTPWPKVEHAKKGLRDLLNGTVEVEAESLFTLLHDRRLPPDSQLPDTGMGLEWERILAPLFIQSVIYGTRSSSLILIDRLGQVTFTERTYDPSANQIAEPSTRSFTFTIEQ